MVYVARMNDGLVIRAANHEDHAQWLPLWEGYNTFYRRTIEPEVTAMSWERFLDAVEPMHCLVAARGGRLVGFTHYLFHRSTSAIASSCYLQDLFTSVDERGKGVGRALIEEVFAAATAAGSARVYWQTHETNTTAMRLYDQVAEKSGFLVYDGSAIRA